MWISPNFQGEREFEFAMFDEFKFLLDQTFLLQVTLRSCHKMNPVIKCAGYESGLLGERQIKTLRIEDSDKHFSIAPSCLFLGTVLSYLLGILVHVGRATDCPPGSSVVDVAGAIDV